MRSKEAGQDLGARSTALLPTVADNWAIAGGPSVGKADAAVNSHCAAGPVFAGRTMNSPTQAQSRHPAVAAE
jgi:hypothetical protein